MSSNYERVWLRFERTLKDGSIKKFRVQEVPRDMYEDVWEFIKTDFLPDEPFSIAYGYLNRPNVMAQLKNFWTKFVLPQNLSVLCVEDKEHVGKPEIVGINNLFLSEQGNETRPEGCSEPEDLLKTFDALFGDFDVYKYFGVTKYLNAAGLAVNKKYRGMNIGVEILLARTPLCKCYDIKATETIFTAGASQRLAEKAGFTTVIEMPFEEIGKKMNKPMPEQFKVCKVMVKVFN